MIEVAVTGIDKLEKIYNVFKKARKELHNKIVQQSRKFAYDIVNQSKMNYLSGPRPDKLGVISGTLRGSIKSRVDLSGSEIKVIMGTNVVYGRIHEVGGWSGRNYKSYMKPRPFIRPAIEDEMPEFQNKLESILGAVANG